MLSYEVRGAVAWLTLDRVEKRNALTRGFFAELTELVGRAGADEAVRAIVIHGAGSCFSVGGDIEGFADVQGAADRRTYLQEAMSSYRAVEECGKPTIAAIHGYALGGGCELSMACDLVVADETARFGLPETAVGLMPGPGSVRARAHLSLHTFKYMVLTGAMLEASQALAAGLVNEVVPAGEHLAKAEEWAQLIAARSPLALATAKSFLSTGAWESSDHAVNANSMLFGSDDHAEGIAAFVDRRPPVFLGR
jgi:enoyl-CoA hydratase/carnithine racemase